jgi:hypothetical protein
MGIRFICCDALELSTIIERVHHVFHRHLSSSRQRGALQPVVQHDHVSCPVRRDRPVFPAAAGRHRPRAVLDGAPTSQQVGFAIEISLMMRLH